MAKARKKKQKADNVSVTKKKGYVYIKSQERDSLFLRRGMLGDMLSKFNTSGMKNKKKKAIMQAKYDEVLEEYNKCTELASRFTEGRGLTDKEEVAYVIYCLGLQKASLEQASPCEIVNRNIGEVNSLIKSYGEILENI